MAWLSGWKYRVKVSIDADDIDDTLTNFPILLHLSSSCGYNSDDVTFVFDELTSNDNRKKIAVTTSDGVVVAAFSDETRQMDVSPEGAIAKAAKHLASKAAGYLKEVGMKKSLDWWAE